MKVTITGQKELMRAMDALDNSVRRRVTKFALRRAGKPISTQARRNVRPISRTIANSIQSESKTYQRGMLHILKIGPSTDPKYYTTKTKKNPLFEGDTQKRVHKPQYTAHLVEGGTKPHTIEVNGRQIQHPGTEAKPFLEPARKEHANNAIRIFSDTAWARIRVEAERAARKARAL